MANFSTHFNVASFVSAIGSGTLFYAGIVDKQEAIILFGGGILGGILPDIDSQNSKPTQIMQYFFSNVISFFVLFNYIDSYPILNLLLIWIGSFMATLTILDFFSKITKHRGMFHSVPAGMAFGFLFSLLFYYIFHFRCLVSWYFGVMIFIGYLTHLILDEIYSVDLIGRRIKKSFGTALKFYSPKERLSTLFFYLILIGSIWLMPCKDIFIESLKKFDIISHYKEMIEDFKR
jgi:hypothetical protein